MPPSPVLQRLLIQRKTMMDAYIRKGSPLPVEGELGVIVTVRTADADDARRILTEDG